MKNIFVAQRHILYPKCAVNMVSYADVSQECAKGRTFLVSFVLKKIIYVE